MSPWPTTTKRSALIRPRQYVYNNRGLVYHAGRDYDQAIADYNQAIRLFPQYAFAYSNRGNAWAARQDFDKAITDYNEAIRLDSRYAVAYNNRAYAWRARKEYDKAIADYNEAIRLDPRYAVAYRNRAYTWDARKDYEKAIADYDEAIRLDPGYFDAYNGRGWLRATCPDARYRDVKKAMESATKACELSAWKEPSTIDTLSAAHADAGNFDAAVQWQLKAIDLLTDEKRKEDYRSRLRLYQAKMPYRDTPP